MRQAQSYIVRIYMRPRSSGLVGTVEVVGTGRREGFSSAAQLLGILKCSRGALQQLRVRPKLP